MKNIPNKDKQNYKISKCVFTLRTMKLQKQTMFFVNEDGHVAARYRSNFSAGKQSYRSYDSNILIIIQDIP